MANKTSWLVDYDPATGIETIAEKVRRFGNKKSWFGSAGTFFLWPVVGTIAQLTGFLKPLEFGNPTLFLQMLVAIACAFVVIKFLQNGEIIGVFETIETRTRQRPTPPAAPQESTPAKASESAENGTTGDVKDDLPRSPGHSDKDSSSQRPDDASDNGPKKPISGGLQRTPTEAGAQITARPDPKTGSESSGGETSSHAKPGEKKVPEDA